jgi:hypothetical protein
MFKKIQEFKCGLQNNLLFKMSIPPFVPKIDVYQSEKDENPNYFLQSPAFFVFSMTVELPSIFFDDGRTSV